MKLSARNQFTGVVSHVTEGAVNGIVSIKLGEDTIKANITNEAIKELGLHEGTKAMAVVKATNVMFAAGSSKIEGISARNQFVGKIVSLEEGAVNGHVRLETASGLRISGSITNEAIEALGLAEGNSAVALVKSTDVIVAVD